MRWVGVKVEDVIFGKRLHNDGEWRWVGVSRGVILWVNMLLQINIIRASD